MNYALCKLLKFKKLIRR